MSWSLIINVAAEHVEILAAELFDLGALGVETHEPGMQLMPGTPALPEGGGRCVAHFRERASSASSGARCRQRSNSSRMPASASLILCGLQAM